MRHKPWIKAVTVWLVVLLTFAWTAPANAMSIREEQQLADEFIRIVKRHFEIVDDPMIVDSVDRIGRKILDQLPPQPFSYQFHVIKEDVYNAFAMPAGYIFINSGLLLAMNTEDELAGILAHEIGHVVARHISQRIARARKIDLATMAGVVAGIFLGAAGGGAGAAQALVIGSAAAGQTVALAYSREDETEADQLGLQYLTQAGYSPAGLLEVLKKIRSRQWFGSQQVPTYMMTHPAVEQRIAHIDTWMAIQGETLTPQRPVGGQTTRFRLMQYRLRALYTDPRVAEEYFKAALERSPDDHHLMHARALLTARTGSRSEAIALLQQALARDAMNPLILGDLGRLYFLEGRLEDARGILSGAVSLPDANPEGWFYLGRTQTALGNYPGAVGSFETLLKSQPDYAPAYYFLGEAYGKWERHPESHFYLGLHHFSRGEDRTAHFHLTRAQSNLRDPDKLETIKRKLETIGKLPRTE